MRVRNTFPGVLEVDDFTPRADEVRASALAAGFGTWRPSKGEVGSSVYDGMGFWGLHSVLLHALTHVVGQPIIPNSMFFRVTNADTEAAYVHSDREAGSYTAVVYLSAHDKPYGTGFFRNKRTGLVAMPSFEEMRKTPESFDMLKTEMVKGSKEDWELLHFVRGGYNRAVVFDAPLFHARAPRHGFSDTAEDGRLVWACHFHTLAGMNNG